MQDLLQQLLNGLSQGSIYALIAVGYTMIYGIIQLINFAHGDVIMVGAYVALGAALMGFGFIPSLILAMITCAILGVVIERVAYRKVRPVSRLAALTSAIGVSLFLQYTMMYFLGADIRSFPADILPERTYTLGGVIVTNKDLLVLGTTLVLVIILQFIIFRTRTGKAMRAVSFDGQAAQLMGINVNYTVAFTFFIGSAMAAAAGMLYGICFNVQPLMGLMPGLKAFIAAVLGGIGSVPGAMLGGILLGMTESLVAAFGGSMYRDAVAFIILILILLIRPTGLLGKGVQEKV
ncbi:MAG TPA: branched-chain amino acid ABC transporter permease [Syntrophomonadaceae bacterium]|nr:branched-chain amino acid ABC transporter permease [Syntrophomonadaceae bacterium]